MAYRIVETEQDRSDLDKVLKQQALPFTVHWEKGRNRSHEQNRLSFQWYMDISRDLGWEVSHARAVCKLEIGVPILRAENESFCMQYDRIIRPLIYEQKLALMVEPIDLPITRIFTMKQFSAYLESIQQRFSGQGVRLTDPEALRAA